MKIEAVILYCSNDERFFKTCISNLLESGIKCNVVTYDHFYAGQPEDIKVLDESDEMFAFNNDYKKMRLNWVGGRLNIYYESIARYAATNYMVDKDCDYILYIDIDEIVDPIPFKNWLNTSGYEQYLGIKLRQHTYALSPGHRLKAKAYNTILTKRIYAQSLPFKAEARLQYFNNKNRVSRWMAKLGINSNFYIYRGEPFIHHYTCARPEGEMIIKMENSPHSKDRNWNEYIYGLFHSKGNKINGTKFELVPNQFNLK